VTLWPNRIIAWLKRIGFWRLLALLAALVVLLMALRGPDSPSILDIRRF
jgi:hypothetical protein